MNKTRQFVKGAVIYALTFAAVGVVALPSSWKTFQSYYNVSNSSNLGQAKCKVCHTSMKGKILNAYGKDLDKILKAEGTKKVNTAALKKVESLNSSGSGGSNISKIKSDQLPGG